jgi:hypothetical protein
LGAREICARFYAIVLERRVQLPPLAAILDRPAAATG